MTDQQSAGQEGARRAERIVSKESSSSSSLTLGLQFKWHTVGMKTK